MNGPEPGKAINQQEIDAFLLRLKDLQEQVVEARKNLADPEREMEQAHQEYMDRIRPLRREISQLQNDINSLLQRMQGEGTNESSEGPGAGGDGDGIGTQTGDGDDTTSGTDTGTKTAWRDEAAAEDPDTVAKDILIEHAYRVLDPMVNPKDAQEIGRLQGLVSNPATTLGEVLETLPWGAIWKQKGQQETLADQWQRLCTWEQALQNQLALLEKGEERLRRDPRYGLWERRREGPEAWEQFQQQSAGQFEQDLEELKDQLQELRAERQGM